MKVALYTKACVASIFAFALCSTPTHAALVEQVIVIGKRDSAGVQEFFDALERQLIAAQLLEQERSMQVVPTDVADANPQTQCSKDGANTRSSNAARHLAANEAVKNYITAQGVRLGSVQGMNIRVIYSDGSSEVWTISSQNGNFPISDVPVAGSQLPANASTAEACRKAVAEDIDLVE